VNIGEELLELALFLHECKLLETVLPCLLTRIKSFTLCQVLGS